MKTLSADKATSGKLDSSTFVVHGTKGMPAPISTILNDCDFNAVLQELHLRHDTQHSKGSYEGSVPLTTGTGAPSLFVHVPLPWDCGLSSRGSCIHSFMAVENENFMQINNKDSMEWDNRVRQDRHADGKFYGKETAAEGLLRRQMELDPTKITPKNNNEGLTDMQQVNPPSSDPEIAANRGVAKTLVGIQIDEKLLRE
eukprot:c53321_g1_i1 orf=134-730(+)